jgi:isocitrate dehydrogenase
MMLVHLGCYKEANIMENAWKKTLEDGSHTQDIFNPEISNIKLGTKEFAQKIVQNLGQKPKSLKEASYKKNIVEKIEQISNIKIETQNKELVGVDIYVDIQTNNPSFIAKLVEEINTENYELQFIASKGLKLWPTTKPLSFESEHWCLRIIHNEKYKFLHEDIVRILNILSKKNIDFIKIENLYNFGEIRGYSLAQGE